METKNWWESRTIWFALATGFSAILNLIGKQVDPAFVGSLADWLTNGATIVTAALTAWGRTQAKTAIGTGK